MVEEEIKRLKEVSMLEQTYCVRPKNVLGDEDLTGGTKEYFICQNDRKCADEMDTSVT